MSEKQKDPGPGIGITGKNRETYGIWYPAILKRRPEDFRKGPVQPGLFQPILLHTAGDRVISRDGFSMVYYAADRHAKPKHGQQRRRRGAAVFRRILKVFLKDKN